MLAWRSCESVAGLHPDRAYLHCVTMLDKVMLTPNAYPYQAPISSLVATGERSGAQAQCSRGPTGCQLRRRA